jgi:hypothetical protein
VKIELCGATREEPFSFDPYSKARGVKRPVCNRTKGHEALGETPHRQYRIKDYFVLAEWGEFHCLHRQINGGLPLRKGGY